MELAERQGKVHRKIRMEGNSLPERLQRIDRKVLYLLLGVVMIGPLFYREHFLPTFVSQEAKGVYEAVEAMPSEKIALLCADYEMGTMGENQPQIEAVMRHLMTLGKRFAIMGQIPMGPDLAQKRAEALATELGKTYGEDWVNWGFLAGGILMLEGLCRDFASQVRQDIKGTPIEKVPAMSGVEDIHDVGLLVDFTGSGIWIDYVRLVYGPYKVPVGVGCTAVVGPELFPYLDSEQLVGQLFGMKGAAEYEEMNQYYDKGDQAMPSLSFAHFLIIALIIISNVGYFWARKQRERSSK